MPISQFSEGLQKIISFLPGTYGTSLVRHHATCGVFREMNNEGYPKEIITAFKDSIDSNLYFFDNEVSVSIKYAILSGTTLILIVAYILLNVIKSKNTNKK